MTENLYRLTGKTAVVTGVSRRIGIGAAIARALAQAGANIFTTYYRSYDETMAWGSHPTEAKRLIDELRQWGLADGIELDLAEPDTPIHLFEAAEATFGPVDILINNATHSINATLETVTTASLDQHYAVNVRGLILLCAEFARRYQGDGNGRIINITSGQGIGPMPGEIAYVATKGAVDALTQTLSAELAARHITVNAVDPGITDTGWIPPDLAQQFTKQAPMGRLGQPQDAARLVAFLASPAANWITGQIIRSRGGM